MRDIISCMTEAQLDTYEIHTRNKIDKLLSMGKVKEAEALEQVIKQLDTIDVCDETGELNDRGLAAVLDELED